MSVDPLSPVADEYPAVDNAFAGVVEWVQVELGAGVEPTPSRRLEAEMATQ